MIEEGVVENTQISRRNNGNTAKTCMVNRVERGRSIGDKETMHIIRVGQSRGLELWTGAARRTHQSTSPNAPLPSINEQERWRKATSVSN